MFDCEVCGKDERACDCTKCQECGDMYQVEVDGFDENFCDDYCRVQYELALEEEEL